MSFWSPLSPVGWSRVLALSTRFPWGVGGRGGARDLLFFPCIGFLTLDKRGSEPTVRFPRGKD